MPVIAPPKRPFSGRAPHHADQKHVITRRQFTVAHELAHALLHEGKEVRYDKDFRVDFRSGVSSLGVDIEEIPERDG
jgi:hypothetical protein